MLFLSMKNLNILLAGFVSFLFLSCSEVIEVNAENSTNSFIKNEGDVEEGIIEDAAEVYINQTVGESPSLRYSAPFALVPKSISLPEGSGIEKLDFRQYSSADMVNFIDFIASSSIIEEGLYFELEGGMEAAMNSLKSNPNVAQVDKGASVEINVDGINGLKMEGLTTMNTGQKVIFQIVLFSKGRTTWQIVAQHNKNTAEIITKVLKSMSFKEHIKKEDKTD